MNDGLKINIEGVSSCGSTIKTSADAIGNLLEDLDGLIAELGKYWRDEIYTQASTEMKANITSLKALQSELVSIGTQIVNIASQYQTNKETVAKMFSSMNE